MSETVILRYACTCGAYHEIRASGTAMIAMAHEVHEAAKALCTGPGHKPCTMEQARRRAERADARAAERGEE